MSLSKVRRMSVPPTLTSALCLGIQGALHRALLRCRSTSNALRSIHLHCRNTSNALCRIPLHKASMARSLQLEILEYKYKKNVLGVIFTEQSVRNSWKKAKNTIYRSTKNDIKIFCRNFPSMWRRLKEESSKIRYNKGITSRILLDICGRVFACKGTIPTLFN